jgi:hypothetical protein
VNPAPSASVIRTYLGSVERRGAWPVPRHLDVRVVLGSCELDLRQATLEPGVTTIDVGVVLGSVEIIVPKGMLVEVGMMAALASVDEPTGFALGGERQVLRVIGDATLASCEIVRAA